MEEEEQEEEEQEQEDESVTELAASICRGLLAGGCRPGSPGEAGPEAVEEDQSLA